MLRKPKRHQNPPLMVSVPAVFDPLIDGATHIKQPKRIWLETADLDRLIDGRNVAAVLAIDHAGLKLIAPPEFGPRAAARRIFPFSFAWQSIWLAGDFREPRGILPGIAPAHVCNRRIVLSARRESACLCGGACIPFPHGDRKFPHRKRLDRYLTDRLFRNVFVAAHREAATPKRDHLGFSNRCGRRRCWLSRRRGGRGSGGGR